MEYIVTKEQLTEEYIFNCFINSKMEDNDSCVFIIDEDNKVIIIYQESINFYTDVGIKHFKVCSSTKDQCEERMYQNFYSIDNAIKCFIGRCLSDTPHEYFGEHEDLKNISIKVLGNFSYFGHYDYLEFVVDEFWELVFGKITSEMHCAGIIGAHGDKGYGYKTDWEEANIPFNHGILLFLLTYTKVMDKKKYESCQWVIDNYPKYLPMIKEAEEKVLKSIKGK